MKIYKLQNFQKVYMGAYLYRINPYNQTFITQTFRSLSSKPNQPGTDHSNFSGGKRFQSELFLDNVGEKKDKSHYAKSLTAKLRHASKTEHHKFEYDEKSKTVFNKEEDLHGKELPIKEFLNILLKRKDFSSYMHKHYSILPMMITNYKVRRFITEVEFNNEYKDHIQKWSELSKEARRELITKEKIPLENFPLKLMIKIKPYIDLMTDFIQRYFADELEASKQLSSITDLSMPHEWFPEARKMVRTIHYHMGPTNSGKTKTAIDHLIKSKNGIYCAPLRLLAWEISEVLSNNGVSCNLITGQEKKINADSTHLACTVEMADFSNEYDIAVIDEIQMIEDADRGFAWTNALLGLKSKEIHICGDQRAFKLISKLLESTGDNLEQHHYQRLSSLHVEGTPIKTFAEFKSGDCIVAFSRKQVFSIKNAINKHFNKGSNASNDEMNHCAVIYGALPPETKKTQAFMFNNRLSDIKFLVATDAVGMGLNLNIQRVIFSTVEKNMQGKPVILDEYTVKQIGGRAGRSTQDGLISAFKPADLQYIRRYIGVNEKTQKNKSNPQTSQKTASTAKPSTANPDITEEEENDEDITIKYEESNINTILDLIESPIKNSKQKNDQKQKNLPKKNEPKSKKKPINFTDQECKIKQACLFPSFQLIQKFADDLFLHEKKKSTLARIIRKFENLAKLNKYYFVRDTRAFNIIADQLEGIENFSLHQQYVFSQAPLKIPINQNKASRKLLVLRKFAMEYCSLNQVVLPKEYHLDHETFNQPTYGEQDLERFEEIHNILEVYLWLGNKYDKEFIELDLCNVMIARVCEIVDSILLSKDQRDFFQ